jgi:hypothetical protein
LVQPGALRVVQIAELLARHWRKALQLLTPVGSAAPLQSVVNDSCSAQRVQCWPVPPQQRFTPFRGEHAPLWQSAPLEQRSPAAQSPQLPPQSTSVSLPF